MKFIKEIIEILEVNTLLYSAVKIALIILITFLVKKAVAIIFDNQVKKRISHIKYETKAKSVVSILKNFLNILIYFVSITAILNVFKINTSSILAIAGVGAVAVGFASKSIVEDIITGSFILLEDQFNIGDLVTINGITGTVNFMGIRITKLKDIEGREIIIPNSEIKTVINSSIYPMRAVATASITSFKGIDFVKTVINEAIYITISKFDAFTQDPKIVGVDDIGDYSYKFIIVGYTLNGRQWEAQRLLKENIVRELIDNNISFSSISVDKL